jgi:hypothetical protein
MELCLNLVWLVLAIASLTLAGWQLSRTVGPKELRALKWQSLIALCCILIILFFVISMTDDIHDQQIVSEGSQSLRLIPNDGGQDSHAKHSHHSGSYPAVCVNSELEPIAYICLGHVEPFSLFDSSICRTTPPSGRDPPRFSA